MKQIWEEHLGCLFSESQFTSSYRLGIICQYDLLFKEVCDWYIVCYVLGI